MSIHTESRVRRNVVARRLTYLTPLRGTTRTRFPLAAALVDFYVAPHEGTRARAHELAVESLREIARRNAGCLVSIAE